MSDLRVSTNSYQQNLIGQINANQSTLVALQKQIASGRKVTMPEDDPIIVGRTMRRVSEKRELVQYRTNNIMAENVIKTSELHLSEMRKLGDLALGVANATGVVSSAVDMAATQRQIDDILKQVLDVANAKHGNDYLFAGSDFDQKPYSLNDNGTPNDPTDDFIEYHGSPTDRSSLDFEESEYYVGQGVKMAPRLNPEHNEDIRGFLQNILDLRNAFSGTFDPTAVSQAVRNMEEGDDALVVATTDLAAKQLRLQTASRFDAALYNQLDAGIADDVGIDLTEVSLKLNQAQLSYQAALASAAKILSLSLMDYV